MIIFIFSQLAMKKECEDILNHTDRFIWLGNVEDFYSGFDISTSSFGEGFSNSIAMSCY